MSYCYPILVWFYSSFQFNSKNPISYSVRMLAKTWTGTNKAQEVPSMTSNIGYKIYAITKS